MSNRLRTLVVAVSTILAAALLMGAMLSRNASDEGAYRQIAVYEEVLAHIKSDYVEEPDLKSVTLGALNGLLEAIDPFASYLSADQYKEYLKNKDASKGEVGLILSKRFGYVGVVDAIPGSPADKAGLTTGDMVETIRGIATRDMPLAYANMLLGGKPGTTVEISLLAMRQREPKKITLTRTEVQYPKVSEKLMAEQVGYIQAQAMGPSTSAEVAAAVKSLERQGAKRLILDLRHSSTGSPEQGIELANLFLDKGLITYLKGQTVPRKDFEADPAKAITKLPLVVLTNRGTAGGAEVAAAALLDDKRAQVVGERTYGDASVRRPIPTEEGGAIILSVAKYYSPGGKAIQDASVTPSVQVNEAEPVAEIEEEGPPETPAPPERPGEDPILKKAIEVVTQGAKG
ncbi:MAG: S41 family peptidase [Bryobacteraceae bacterium]|jgi:carboxyl-terminal processing protease